MPVGVFCAFLGSFRLVRYLPAFLGHAAKVTDNKAMLKYDPGYIGHLKAMSEFDQEQLLNGNWKIRRSAGHYFKRSKVGQMLTATPTDVIRWVRAWDLAATAPGEADESDDAPQAFRRNARSDGSAYTAGVLYWENGATDAFTWRT